MTKRTTKERVTKPDEADLPEVAEGAMLGAAEDAADDEADEDAADEQAEEQADEDAADEDAEEQAEEQADEDAADEDAEEQAEENEDDDILGDFGDLTGLDEEDGDYPMSDADRSFNAGENVLRILRSTATKRVPIKPETNLHEHLGIAGAEFPAMTKEINEEFGIDITASEADNWLLARDVVNTVLRKLNLPR